MIFQRVNRSDAEKIFVVAKNGSGATLTQSYPAYWDCEMTTPDGVQVTNAASSTTLNTFCGYADSSISNGSYGLVQVYGYRASARVLSSTGSSVAGDDLISAATGMQIVASQGSQKAFGFAMAAVTASSSSAFATTANIFIRAL